MLRQTYWEKNPSFDAFCVFFSTVDDLFPAVIDVQVLDLIAKLLHEANKLVILNDKQRF